MGMLSSLQSSSVQLLSSVWFFAISWTVVCQASLSITNSWSLLKLMSKESVMPCNHLILVIPFSSHLQSFAASGSFPMSWLFASGGQSTGVSASTSVLPVNVQDWFPLWDILAVQGTLKSLLQHHSSKASILWHSVFFVFSSFLLMWILPISYGLNVCALSTPHKFICCNPNSQRWW